MRIQVIELANFRNIATAKVHLAEGFNVLVGRNGHGKTNFLEAIYSLSALRPLRNARRRDLIRAGADHATIHTWVRAERTSLTHELRVDLGSKTRELQKDGKRCEAKRFIGSLVTVAFTPDDLQLTKAGPEHRRRFIDRAILNLRPAYLETALRYAQALRSHNRLLQDGGADRLLRPYQEILAAEGAKITAARAEHLRGLGAYVTASFEEIARPSASLGLLYRASTEFEGRSEVQIEQQLLRLLEESLPLDRRRRLTTVGPHRDDLEISLGGSSARERASQGQHRAVVLALKLGEIRHLAHSLGEPPVLLLDDISSELDPERSIQLLTLVAGMEAQTILTTTDARGWAWAGPLPRWFQVEAGRVAQLDSLP